MSTRSGPGGARPGPGLGAAMSERRQLLNLAYRLLGSLAEAEDAVQETYARWYALPAPQRDAIASPGGWLTTVTSRICLDLPGSARARRERYVGAWLPEPRASPMPSGPRRAAATQPPCPSRRAGATTALPEKGASPRRRPTPTIGQTGHQALRAARARLPHVAARPGTQPPGHAGACAGQSSGILTSSVDA
jgi:hypothetical protein